MYFTRTQESRDASRTEYNAVGMADTGTRRHVAIQEVLLKMEEHGYDWRYLDVGEYLEKKWAEQKCLDIEIRGKYGAETHLFHKTLLISFMCDGIMERISTGQCFLFEFKNQISFKFSTKQDDYEIIKDSLGNRVEVKKIDGPQIDSAHINQVACYGYCLDLDYALVLYENRDNCTLEVPELFEITKERKEDVVSRILECEGYVERLIPPPKTEDTKSCRWCAYATACKRAGG
jgi:hypothetical protein